MVAVAGDHDRARRARQEGADLAAIAGQPRRVLVAQPDVDGQAIGHLEVVLHVAVPVVGLAAEDVGREGAGDRARIAEEEVGEGVAGAGRAGGVLGQRAVVVPLPGVLLAVGEERLPAAVLAAELDDVAALHPGQVVADLVDLQVLRLRPLIEGRAVHRGVAAPGEVGERAADAGPLGFLEAADAERVVRVLSLEERLEIDDRGHVAEADVVQQRSTSACCSC